MSKYTKTGFSKPFDCCGHWKVCEMGKKPDQCHYKTRDPETMENCSVYRRAAANPVLTVETPLIEKEVQTLVKPVAQEQLTLF